MKAPRRRHAATMWQQRSGDMVAMLAQQRGAAVEARKPEVVVVLSLLEEKKATVELAAS